MDTSGNLDALVERVLERARQQAAEIVDRAGKAAEREIVRAREQCESRKQAAEAVVREAAERRKHSAHAEAEQEQRRAVMNAREAAVDDVFTEVLSSLGSIPEPGERLRLLEQLVREALRALGAPSVRVRLNQAERDLARASGFPGEIDKVTVVIDEETIETCGGPVVTDDSGRVVFENTFEARLDRMRDHLRRLVAETVRLEDRKEGPRPS
jgi:V/A-type H+-transporting ATPase subunit E